MDTSFTNQVAYVEVTDEMNKREQALSNAVVASPLNPTKPKLLITDIQLALQNKFGESAQPTKIESFPPDFILHFPTPYMQQTVLSYGSIEGPKFILRLSPWTNEYRCTKIPYNTLVTHLQAAAYEWSIIVIYRPRPLFLFVTTFFIPHYETIFFFRKV